MIKDFNELVGLARSRGTKVMAVAVAQDEEVLEAVKNATEEKLVKPILVGEGAKIKEIAKAIDFDLTDIEIIEELDEVQAARKAVSLVSSGKADLLMKGLVGTATILSQALDKEIGLRTGKVISQVTAFSVPTYHKLMFITDPAMNIAPDLNDKKRILDNALELTEALEMENPKVAAITAVEKVSKHMIATQDAAELKKMNENGEITGCILDGPLALDNAISKESARIKKIEGEVAGDADVLLMPNIESGNVLYKALTFLANAKSAGLIVGAAAPIVLTSRADSHETKFNSIALGVLMAN